MNPLSLCLVCLVSSPRFVSFRDAVTVHRFFTASLILITKPGTCPVAPSLRLCRHVRRCRTGGPNEESSRAVERRRTRTSGRAVEQRGGRAAE